MSTTFNVFPLSKELPVWGLVLDLSTSKLYGFLKDYGVDFDVEMKIKLLSKKITLSKILTLILQRNGMMISMLGLQSHRSKAVRIRIIGN
jgi:hypothetical protein